MVKQERAARTRKILVDAAALEFDRDGYEGTSLARISKAAGISSGAVTFHFAHKGALAGAILGQGRAAAREVLEKVAGDGADPLGATVRLTLELARLLESDVVVRAAARLAREQSRTLPGWYCVWLPTVRQWLAEAGAAGLLRPGVQSDVLATTVGYLLTGLELRIRARAFGPEEGAADGPAVEQLERIWRLVLRGVATDPPA
ncbi:AcrR family transcriptional regulator [Kitasatospora gansuensis]|uniref:AcrR family transcriptional regulator n=1 Tax=Kitasatospora gansuensis TaxID=258050 RepID=A0A7W7SBP4_9ACTN|nr:TetR/AcrR family transcriptional regulator [Kitasatospora gansuensis]MBB4947327.1 AcrR family transcriptional regulator [Kitasatospora gansuensis]